MRIFITVLTAMFCFSNIGIKSASAQDVVPLQAISSLDLEKYAGRWFEVAKYPNRFQSMCITGTNANYRLLVEENEPTVEVTNRCQNQSGSLSEVIGSARPVGKVMQGKLQPAKLEVAFAPSWLRWLPVVWGNYWVVEIDPAYRWVLVSEPKREFAWILSRTPSLSETDRNAALLAVKKAGLDEKRLDWTKH